MIALLMAATDDDPGLTIDELAATSRVPSRTIRFYQSRGALMTPEIRGRVAYYGKPHLERLKLIAQLQDRGLRIDAIGDLMKRIDRGEVDQVSAEAERNREESAGGRYHENGRCA